MHIIQAAVSAINSQHRIDVEPVDAQRRFQARALEFVDGHDRILHADREGLNGLALSISGKDVEEEADFGITEASFSEGATGVWISCCNAESLRGMFWGIGQL